MIAQFDYSGGFISFQDQIFKYQSFEVLDLMAVHIFVDDGQVFCFLGGETIINGTMQPDADSIIAIFEAR